MRGAAPRVLGGVISERHRTFLAASKNPQLRHHTAFGGGTGPITARRRRAGASRARTRGLARLSVLRAGPASAATAVLPAGRRGRASLDPRAGNWRSAPAVAGPALARR